MTGRGARRRTLRRGPCARPRRPRRGAGSRGRGQKGAPVPRPAGRELERARPELRAAQAMARAEAARLRAAWERAERQVRRYRQAIIPQTSAAIDAARFSSLAGRGDFSTVVEDFNFWLDARAQLAMREADRFMVWAELETLITPSAAAAAEQGDGQRERRAKHPGTTR